MHVEHDELIFDLPGDWRAVPSSDREQMNFESEALSASIVLSVMSDLTIPVSRLEATARKFAAIRTEAEIAARAPGAVRFDDPWIQLKSDLAELGYAGSDDTGMKFRFYGVVTTRKVVSVWIATDRNDEKAANQIVDDAIKGLRVVIP
jgi:hypothetical protein